MTAAEFAHELRRYKRLFKMTTPELARRLDITDRTLKNWLAEKPPLPVAQEGTLARLHSLAQERA